MSPARKTWGFIASATAIIASIAAGGYGLAVAFGRAVVTPARVPAAPLTVREVRRSANGDTIVLTQGEDAALAGDQSFIFAEGNGHARVGAVVREQRGTVERELLSIERGRLEAGATGRITGWWFTSPDEVSDDWSEVTVPGPLGDLPAWRIGEAGQGSRAWVIHVHGRGARREETLRGVDPLTRAGFSHLVLSYRNDPGAPAAPDAKYGLGATESEDVSAAIAYAAANGAETVLLVGWSMGAAAALIAAERAKHGLIAGIVLESPGIDWPGILRHQARRSRVPSPAARFGARLLERGSRATGVLGPVPVSRLTPERFASELRVPVLQLVSREDTFVPAAGALRLARLRPDLVRTVEVPGAEHVKLWNHDRAVWESALYGFGRQCLGDGSRG